MGLTLQVSIILGLASGVWLGVSAIEHRLLMALLSSLAFLGLWLFEIGPAVGFVGAMLLLLRPMRHEQRGVVGFITLLGSLPTIVVLSLIMFQ